MSVVQETWVQSLGWEDPLEKGMAIHSSFLAWRIPRDRRAWQPPVHGVTQVGHDLATKPPPPFIAKSYWTCLPFFCADFPWRSGHPHDPGFSPSFSCSLLCFGFDYRLLASLRSLYSGLDSRAFLFTWALLAWPHLHQDL